MKTARSQSAHPTAGRPWAALAGGTIWLATVMVLAPSPFETVWARTLLMLSPLVLVPLGLSLVKTRDACASGPLFRTAEAIQMPAALLLGGSLFLQPGLAAAALSVPWLVFTGLVALYGLTRAWDHIRGPLHDLTFDAGLVYIVVGGAWVVSDRLGFRPLDFDSVIVLLTAIHFHYAGFVLPLVTGLALRESKSRIGWVAGAGVVSGIPLVAAGITATQLKLGSVLECVSASWLALAGMLAAWLHFELLTQSLFIASIRRLWAIAATSLFFSMLLAAAYGARFYLPIAWLDIPWMRALHGTANALGFGLCSLMGWVTLLRRRNPECSSPRTDR